MAGEFLIIIMNNKSITSIIIQGVSKPPGPGRQASVACSLIRNFVATILTPKNLAKLFSNLKIHLMYLGGRGIFWDIQRKKWGCVIHYFRL